jgi:hypothetical protein
MVLALLNAAFAVTMFSTGLWIIGLLNTVAALFSLYMLILMSAE